MNLGISGKAGLVTGASSGIGRGIALALAAEGVKLAIAGASGFPNMIAMETAPLVAATFRSDVAVGGIRTIKTCLRATIQFAVMSCS